MKPIITYYYRGMIQQRRSSSIKNVSGYSQNGPTGNVLYPWRSEADCRAEARKAGAVPRFMRTMPC